MNCDIKNYCVNPIFQVMILPSRYNDISDQNFNKKKENKISRAIRLQKTHFSCQQKVNLCTCRLWGISFIYIHKPQVTKNSLPTKINHFQLQLTFSSLSGVQSFQVSLEAFFFFKKKTNTIIHTATMSSYHQTKIFLIFYLFFIFLVFI